MRDKEKAREDLEKLTFELLGEITKGLSPKLKQYRLRSILNQITRARYARLRPKVWECKS